MLKTKLRRTSLIVLAVLLTVSMLSLNVFADENEVLNAPANDAAGIVTEAADDATVGEEAPEGATDADGTAAETANADETDVQETTPETKPAEETEGSEAGEGEGETEEEKKGLTASDIISLIILGVVVIAVAVYCIVKREKVGKFFRSLKSEFKKIVWSSPEQVRKNTIVVLVVVIALAVVIGLLDLLFSRTISALSILF